MSRMRLIRFIVLLSVSATPYAVATDKATPVLTSPTAVVTVEDIERYIRETLPPDETARLQILQRPGIYREMAENIYLIRTLAAEAEAGPDFDPEQQRWANRHRQQRQLMQDYRSSYVEQRLQDVNWDSVAREHYTVYPERYKRPERVRASHILVRVGPERSEEEASTLISALHKRLIAGEDFGELAREYSEDNSATNGGALGYFERGRMVAPFEKAAFALEKEGDFSEPVRSEFGYHLILLEDRQPEEPLSFDKVKGSIIKQLQVEMADSIWQEKLVRLRSSQAIELDEELLAELRAAQGVSAAP